MYHARGFILPYSIAAATYCSLKFLNISVELFCCFTTVVVSFLTGISANCFQLKWIGRYTTKFVEAGIIFPSQTKALSKNEYTIPLLG